MARATRKAQGIEDALTALTGKHRPTVIAADLCMTCEREALTFRDKLSAREYAISGMCQRCQDEAFGI